MPIVDGKYVAPTWYNDTNPPINSAELQDICDSIEKVPIANGGTGATTIEGARANLGIVGTGNANTPIYLDANGAPQAMSGALPISLGGSGMTGTTTIYGNVDNAFLIVKWGKVVTFRYRSATSLLTTRTINLVSQISLPSDCLPRTAVYLLAPGTSSAGDADAAPKIFYNVTILTNGMMYITAPQGNTTACYPRFTATWLTA